MKRRYSVEYFHSFDYMSLMLQFTALFSYLLQLASARNIYDLTYCYAMITENRFTFVPHMWFILRISLTISIVLF